MQEVDTVEQEAGRIEWKVGAVVQEARSEAQEVGRVR